MNRKKCVVKNCESLQISGERTIGHQFPKLKSCGPLWIGLTGNEDLKELSLEDITSQRLFICCKHFEKDCFYYTQYGARRLTANALPTLYLPAKDENKNATEINLPDKENSPSVVNISSAFDSPSMGKLIIHKSMEYSPGVRESSLGGRTVSYHLLNYL